MIIGGILIIIIAVVGVLLFLNSKNKSTAVNANTPIATDNTNTNTNTSTTPDPTNPVTTPVGGILASDKIKKLSDSSVVAPILSVDEKAVWFFTNDGHLYKVNLSTGLKQESLLPEKLTVSNAIWPQLGNDFIVVSGSGSAKTFSYYNSDLANTAGQKFGTFPANVHEIDYLQDGKHIAYNWVNGATSTLAIANFDLANYENIVTLPAPDLNIKMSPNGNRALLYNETNSGDGNLYYVSFKTKKLITLHTSMDNAAIWSGDGIKFLYNRDSGDGTKNTKLWLGDSDTATNKEIALNGSVSKATFDKSGNFVFVAVSNGDSDDIWKVDTKTLAKTKVFSGTDSGTIKINATNLFVSADDATLYFKNDDGYLYSVPIK
ncbi:MAG: hypothetical protein JWO40_823 [Candidatus Doudnabacteria bacterium]|nr:hypothetical protein [Candidatus Doudnabacteria bacterium]